MAIPTTGGFTATRASLEGAAQYLQDAINMLAHDGAQSRETRDNAMECLDDVKMIANQAIERIKRYNIDHD